MISILTVVRNRCKTVGQALDSVAAQASCNLEHIVQGAVSTDGTDQILCAKAKENSRIKLIIEPDAGMYDGLNRAFARSSGEIIGLLHSDDFFAHAEVLARVEKLFRDTGADAVYGDLDYVSATNSERIVRRWRSGEYHRARFARGWMPPHPALFVRRGVIERWGIYDTSFRIAADYEVILRYFWVGGISAAYLPEVLVKMRLGGESNRSIGRIIRKTIEDYRALRKNQVGGVTALALKNLSKVNQFLPERKV